MGTLQEKLDRIRNPNLQNQAQSVTVLKALEEILKEQNTAFTPTAYFSALLSILNQYITPTEIVNKDLGAAVVYLLDIVAPFVPEPLLRTKFVHILSRLAPAITNGEVEAPILKSSIGILETLLLMQDGAGWAIPQSEIGPRRAVAGLFNLCLDPRPKVRKRAQDALSKILQNPPPSPSIDHPASDMCAGRSLQALVELVPKIPKLGQHDPKTIHALQLVRVVAAGRGWPTKRLEPLCEVLLNIMKSNNELMVTSALGVFEMIFDSMSDEASSAKLPKILEAVSELRPSKNDTQLLPPWLAVISRGYGVSAMFDPEQTLSQLPDLFILITSFLESSSYEIRTSASQCAISLVVNCIPDNALLNTTKSQNKHLRRIASTASDLLNVRYQGAWKEVFEIFQALFIKLRWRSNLYLQNIVQTVGELRSDEAFNGKKEADEVLKAAISAMGPDCFLILLPLNLLNPGPDQQGRAWLLPLLRDSTQNTNLSHFRQEFVPLFESLHQRIQSHSGAKTMEMKVFETVIQQIWSIFPGYCTIPLDMDEAFDLSFAELLANVLYAQPELRVSICQGLQNLVETNKAILEVEAETEDEKMALLLNRVSKADAKQNLDLLSSFASNILLVLFNIYNETLPQFRGYILHCADAYLSVMKHDEIAATFGKVTEALHSALSEAVPKQADRQKAQEKGASAPNPMSHNLMDLVVTISPYLAAESMQILFNVFNAVVNKKADPQLQKKAYKVIPRIMESEVGRAALEHQVMNLQALLRTTQETTSTPARRDRLCTLEKVVELLPRSDLTFVFAIVGEVIQACKEPNEKARAMAFDLLVTMGVKMQNGGIIKRSMLEFSDENEPDVEASLEDYFLMVCGGLASPEPHMISATITAITRIIYHFKDELKSETIQEMVSTMDTFLTSKNREIVRSVLGFVKVSVISFPRDMMLARLGSLVPNLMVWSHEHKAHFKAKVKHIIERMIRRFGYDAVEKHVPIEDKKLVINIRKTRDRKKKKKDAATMNEGDDDGDVEVAKVGGRRFASEFEEAIYGSESDDSDADDDDDADAGSARAMRKSGGQAKRGQQFIVEDEDEPLDLLDRKVLSRISSTKLRQAKPSKEKMPAKTNKAGKLVFGYSDEEGGDDDNDDDGIEPPNISLNPTTMATGEFRDGISAYIEALKGKDAFRRGQRDRIKFSNKRKQGQDRDEDDEDEEMADAGESGGRNDWKTAASKKKGAKNSGHQRKQSSDSKVLKSPKRHSHGGMRGGGTASIGRKKW